MADDRRTRVEESARYLRNVRPIDPEEVATYVEGGAHPGVIREDLRTLAPTLGLIERADGTFVPVAEDSVDFESETGGTLPSAVSRCLSDLLVERWGRGWPNGGTGDQLRELISELKADYEAGRSVQYDEDVALAYAVYHLPTHFAAVSNVVAELARDGLLSQNLRVLDVGAGVGSAGLAIADGLPEDALLEYHAIEPSDAVSVLEDLLDTTGRNVHTTVHSDAAESQPVAGPFDLILFSSVLSELNNPEGTATAYLDCLAEDGTMALVTTGDKVTSTTLRAVERAIVDDRKLASVYAPTVRFWPDHRPTDRGWSWTRQPDIETPGFQSALDDGSGTYVNTSVRYSYALLRPDGKQRHDITLSRAGFVPMAESEDHVTNRVDVGCVLLSPDLGAENPLYKVSDGSESVDHYGVLVHESDLTRTLRNVSYGTPLKLENALLLWNDDEAGYNLVVDDEAIVDPL